MDYRREIDGLRALAVLPVILCHAGFKTFSGGFIGVDIFFVISGYLITTLILADLDKEKFSILKFYERRARRILPALFLVMAVCLCVGYFTLMPDEFKNLGQSLFATTLFSNNILLGITSGYWNLASEFKPLLHTWSLGVEEQYYVIVPIILLLAWRNFNKQIPLIIFILFFGSFSFAVWLVNISPDWAFYILPTRAWELLLGAIGATLLRSNPSLGVGFRLSNALSLIGLSLILIPIFLFDEQTLSPGAAILFPNIGALLIILYAKNETVANKILSHQVLIYIGLMSYSLYLWHQPFFAFLRAYSADEPSALLFILSIPFIAFFSYLSWRFVEKPFRSSDLVSRSFIVVFSFVGSLFFISVGLYLNLSYGMASRIFDKSINISELDKRIYNQRIFAYKNDNFEQKNKIKILIIGDSFARDFTNITLESFDTSGVDIVYRDDLSYCILPYKNKISESLFTSANVIVFSSGDYSKKCLSFDLDYALNRNKRIYYVGTKNFGFNLNWVIRFSDFERRNQYNLIPDKYISFNSDMFLNIRSPHFIDLLSPVLKGGKVPITDDSGRMLSVDRLHLTRYGAIYFGQKAVAGSDYAKIFE